MEQTFDFKDQLLEHNSHHIKHQFNSKRDTQRGRCLFCGKTQDSYWHEFPKEYIYYTIWHPYPSTPKNKTLCSNCRLHELPLLKKVLPALQTFSSKPVTLIQEFIEGAFAIKNSILEITIRKQEKTIIHLQQQINQLQETLIDAKRQIQYLNLQIQDQNLKISKLQKQLNQKEALEIRNERKNKTYIEEYEKKLAKLTVELEGHKIIREKEELMDFLHRRFKNKEQRKEALIEELEKYLHQGKKDLLDLLHLPQFQQQYTALETEILSKHEVNVNQLNFIMDEHCISMATINALHTICKFLPTIEKISSARKIIQQHSGFPITMLSNGAYIDPVVIIQNWIKDNKSLLMLNNNLKPHLLIGFHIDGTNSTKRSSLTSWSIEIFDHHCKVLSSVIPFCYTTHGDTRQNLKEGIQIFWKKFIELEKAGIAIATNTLSVHTLLLCDMKTLYCICGLSVQNTHPCLTCTITKDDLRTAGSYPLRKTYTKGIEGVKEDPLICGLDPNRIIYCNLHCGLRVGEKLLKYALLIVDDIDFKKYKRNASPQQQGTCACHFNEALKSINISHWTGRRDISKTYCRIELTKEEVERVAENFESHFYPIIEKRPEAKDLLGTFKAWKSIIPYLFRLEYPNKEQVELFKTKVHDFFDCISQVSFTLSPYIHVLSSHIPDELNRVESISLLSTQRNEMFHKISKLRYMQTTQKGKEINRMKRLVEVEARQLYQQPREGEKLKTMRKKKPQVCGYCHKPGHNIITCPIKGEEKKRIPVATSTSSESPTKKAKNI